MSPVYLSKTICTIINYTRWINVFSGDIHMHHGKATDLFMLVKGKNTFDEK